MIDKVLILQTKTESMKKVVSFLLLMVLGALTLFGQSRTVTGTVAGADDGARRQGDDDDRRQ